MPTDKINRSGGSALRDKGRKVVEKKAVALERLSVEYVGIDDVSPNAYNPNRQSDHDFELLLRSIEEDGFTQPIIVTREGVIVDGEHRWRAAKHLGHPSIPIVRVDMTPEQMRISTIRHNRARGSHDIELEAGVLRDLRALGALDWAQDSLMLDDSEVKNLLEDISAPDALGAAEYSQAWAPGQSSEGNASTFTTETKTFSSAMGGTVNHAATSAAIDAQRAAEVRIAAAKSEQEKIAIRKDLDTYRVNLLFSDTEAETVKAVLGDGPGARPAEALLALCRAELTRRTA